MSEFGISQPVRRVEDARFVTGAGRYVDDLAAEGALHAAVVRSPLAAARITGVDATAARAAPGVAAVVLGADLEAAGANELPCWIPMRNRDGSRRANPRRPVVATDRVRFVGEALAFVIAGTPEQARDAAALVDVDYDPLPAAADTARADAADRALVHDDVARNVYFDWEHGDAGAVDAAFAGAAHVTRVDLINNRVVANPMEPRGALAEWDAADGRLTLHTNTQGGWDIRDTVAGALGLDADRVRVLTPDVGGGFGMKTFPYPEHVLCAFAARGLERPVKWIGDRGEAFVADAAGRDHATTVELAFDGSHRILGMRVETRANLGAYLSQAGPFIPTMAAVKVLPGVYDVKQLHYRVLGVATNTVPTDAYRGAGRPEAIYVIERAMDAAARELGVDRAELRRANFIPAAAMPFRTAAGETYDSGDFARVLDAALANADWAGFEARRAAARARGARRGIGLSYYVESTMGEPSETAAIRFGDDATVSVLVGTQSNGQGHETAYTQILVEHLGVPFERVRVVQGDTDAIPAGGGTGGSRSVTAQGWAIRDASEVVIERGRRLAALELETAPDDVEFDAGAFRVVGTDRSIAIMDLAGRARARIADGAPGRDDLPGDLADGLDGTATASIEAWTFPNGCHVAELEIDPETGAVTVERYTVVDDFGRVINPLLLAGQVHGGIAQGIGQALMEHAVYDGEAQLLTGSFMDYRMPRADDFPAFDFSTVEIPCLTNPLGMKGCGEAGTVGSTAAIVNAAIDALADAGVTGIDMPLTPMKLWRALAA